MNHYHVIGSLYGCMPSLNDVYTSKKVYGMQTNAQQTNTTQTSQAVFIGNLTEAWIKTRRLNHISKQGDRKQ